MKLDTIRKLPFI